MGGVCSTPDRHAAVQPEPQSRAPSTTVPEASRQHDQQQEAVPAAVSQPHHETQQGSMPGPPPSTPGALGELQLLHDAQQLRDTWLSNISEQGITAAELEQDVESTLLAFEKVITFAARLFSRRKSDPAREKSANLQELEIKRTGLENAFAEYSVIGQVMIRLAGPAMASFPFGAPAAACLGAVYARAAQAAKLSKNCEELLAMMKKVDAQLARVLCRLVQRGLLPPNSMEEALQRLLQTLVEGGKLMRDYAQRGFIMRFILSSGDAQRFAALDRRMHESMQWTSFCGVMELMSGSYTDESAALRAAVCAVAGLPGDEQHAQQALQQLRQKDPGLLRKLLRKHSNFSEQVIASELDALAERVVVLEVDMRGGQGGLGELQQGFREVRMTVAQLLVKQEKAALSQEEYTQLAGYLRDWWMGVLGKCKSVPTDLFCTKLVDYLREHNLLDQLLEYEKEVKKSGASLVAASTKASMHGGRQLFLDVVVLPLLDQNQDDLIDRSELLGLQITAQEFAKRVGDPPPASWGELLEAVFQGYSLEAPQAKGWTASKSPEADFIEQGLQVRHIIQSYAVSPLLESYVPSTRQWLFDRLTVWLERAMGPNARRLENRMFLLLAGPGMGKSVFSAVMERKLVVQACGRGTVHVRHFFKVGEQRQQGKVMVLCLAQQLADQIPRFRELLKPVVRREGSGANLTMREAFKKYLLDPLNALSKEMEVGQQQRLVALVLLDALDEAADGKSDFHAVAAFVAQEFIKLPSWVKLIVTGRPQAEQPFAAWQPEWIEPSKEDNMRDMCILLEHRLQQGGHVAQEDMQAAVKMMLEKSQGQFIWTRFAFDEISSRDGQWQLNSLQQALPYGLHGVYRHVVSSLEGALSAEQPDLLALMRQKLLPTLGAGFEPFTPDQLATITRAEMPQMELLLLLLTNLFPVRAEGGTGVHKVVPYHKSVLDWMMDPKGGAIDVQLGHEVLGQACFNTIRAAATAFEAAQVESRKPDVEFDLRDGLLKYALRHALTHLLTAKLWELADNLLLDFNYFWPAVYTAGYGPDIVRGLLQTHEDSRSDVLLDALRWLRSCGQFLAEYPRACLQFACDAPIQTIVSKHANQLPQKPLAKLLNPRQKCWGACLSTLTGHRSGVQSVAIRGNTVVSGSTDGLRVWDLHSGECRSVLKGHDGHPFGHGVNSVALSTDAKTCVSGCEYSKLRVWDVQSGQCKCVLKGHSGEITSVAFSGTTHTCVSGSKDKTIRVWDVLSGQCKSVLEGHSEEVTSVALDGSATMIVSGSEDSTIRVWDLSSAVCKDVLKRHDMGKVSSVALSKDARLCVSGSWDKALRVWDFKDGVCRTITGHRDCLTSVALSMDARTLVSASRDNTIMVWDLQSGKCKGTMRGREREWVMSVALSADATLCVSGSGHTVRVWDLQSQGQTDSALAGHRGSITSVALSVDANTCVSKGSEGTIRVWDMQTGKCKLALEGHDNGICYETFAVSADCKTCVSIGHDTLDGKNIRVLDLESGKCKGVLKGHGSRVRSVYLTRDGEICVSGAFDETVRVWCMQSGQCMRVLEGLKHGADHVALTPDAKMCVSSAVDFIRTWDLETGNEVSCHANNFQGISEKQKDLLRQWRAPPYPSADVTGKASYEEATITWDHGEEQPTTIYLPPSLRPEKGVPLLPNKAAGTLSFFGRDRALYTYKLDGCHALKSE